MSPTTPSHLALPTHSEGGGPESSTYFQDADGGCWPVNMCFHTIKGMGIGAIIYFQIFFLIPTILFRPHRNITATFPDHCPYSSPICNVEAAIFYGDFLSFQRDVWHSWQIGCGSEGDGVWKQCPCLDYTRSGHIHKGSLMHKYMSFVCVRHLTLNTSEPGSPALRQNKRFSSRQGDDTRCKTHHT